MGNFSKWIGGGLGWVLGGPLGAIAGFIIGSIIDTQSDSYKNQSQTDKTTPGGFIVSLLVLTSAVMKADGKITKGELNYVKQFFVKAFGAAEAQEAILMLRDLLKQNIPVEDVCLQIKTKMDKSSRLHLFNYLFGISQSDGNVTQNELKLLEYIAHLLGLSNEEYKSTKSSFVTDSNWAYEILEITPSANDEEIKKAYRKMALKYHPDKVEYLGEDFKRSANEKFQKLNKAYEIIKKERNIA